MLLVKSMNMLLQFKLVIPLKNNVTYCDKNLLELFQLLDMVAVKRSEKFDQKKEARDL